MPSNLFPLLLLAHVTLAVCLLLPSILLPFALRTRRAAVDSDSRWVRGLLFIQAHGTVAIGFGVAVTGLAMIAALGSGLLEQPWLVLALVLYVINLGLALFIQRPNLRRLVGLSASADDPVWKERARRQRYVSYVMFGLVGVIGYLMMSKPTL
jgi:uncharacterized membrane protein